MPLIITNQKDLEYDSTSQKMTSLNQTNDHLDVQVYVQIRVSRHSLQTRSSRHSQTRVKHRQCNIRPNTTQRRSVENVPNNDWQASVTLILLVFHRLDLAS